MGAVVFEGFVVWVVDCLVELFVGEVADFLGVVCGGHV